MPSVKHDKQMYRKIIYFNQSKLILHVPVQVIIVLQIQKENRLEILWFKTINCTNISLKSIIVTMPNPF